MARLNIALEGGINTDAHINTDTYSRVTLNIIVQDSQAAISDHNSPALVADATNLLQFFHSISYRIVEKYIDTRLELAKFNALVDEESDGFQDWETYGDQLISIAALARLDPHNTLLRLQGLLHDRIERLQSFLSTTHDGNHPDYVVYIYEHLHWLIVITGYVFADNNIGETALIPETLNELSKTQTLAQDQLINIFSNLMSLLDSVSLDSHSAQVHSDYWFIYESVVFAILPVNTNIDNLSQ